VKIICLFLAAMFFFVTSVEVAYAGGDATQGEKVFKKCKSCHTIKKSGGHKFGPNLYGAFGSTAGSKEKYRYSKGMKKYGKTWCEENLDRFLKNPKKEVPGTKMPFKLKKEKKREDVIAYLRENSDDTEACAKKDGGN